MRPTSTVLCATWLLIAVAAPSTHAQRDSSSAAISADSNSGEALRSVLPLMSSTGRPPTAQSQPGDNSPASGLRNEPLRSDHSWTHSARNDQRSPSIRGQSDIGYSQQAFTDQSLADIELSRTSGRTNVIQAQFTSTDPPLPSAHSQRGSAISVKPTQATAQNSSIDSAQNSKSASQEPRALKPPSKSDANAESKRSSGTVQMFISVVSSLLIVVGLLLGAAWCYRKAAPNASGTLPKQVIQILGRTPLAPRQQLVLLRFGPKLLLVSNLQGEVRTISEIVDPLEVDRVAGMCESSQPGSISDSFRSVLHNIGRTG